MDLTALTDYGDEAVLAVATAGGLYILAVVATQGFPFVASWIRKIRAGASGR